MKGYNTHLGYGIDIDQRYNQKIIGHSGGWYGIHCELMNFINDHYTVVILSNIDDGGKKGASKVADFFKILIADKKKEKQCCMNHLPDLYAQAMNTKQTRI
tara:strand:+ start:935 stop:1237 length:303 start_codon:yes stop_codon:yes gene_type:complete